MLLKHIGLTTIFIMLLSGCGMNSPVILLPIKMESVDAVENKPLSNSVETQEALHSSPHRLTPLKKLSNYQKQVLFDAFKRVIGDNEYFLMDSYVNNLRVNNAIVNHHNRTLGMAGLLEMRAQEYDTPPVSIRRTLTAEQVREERRHQSEESLDCYTYACQLSVVSGFPRQGVRHIAYAYVGERDGDYSFSIAITDILTGLKLSKSDVCEKCDYSTLLNRVEGLQHASWMDGAPVYSDDAIKSVWTLREMGAMGELQSRSPQEVQLVIDRNKGRLLPLFRRALLEDPDLSGKVIFEVTIEPTGMVSEVRIESSDLNSPDLERDMLGVLRSFKFLNRPVNREVISVPINFYPN